MSAADVPSNYKKKYVTYIILPNRWLAVCAGVGLHACRRSIPDGSYLRFHKIYRLSSFGTENLRPLFMRSSCFLSHARLHADVRCARAQPSDTRCTFSPCSLYFQAAIQTFTMAFFSSRIFVGPGKLMFAAFRLAGVDLAVKTAPWIGFACRFGFGYLALRSQSICI